MTSNRRSRRALLATSAAIAAAAIAPAAANAAVSVTVTGDDGNPVALGGTLNIRNMSPMLAIAVGRRTTGASPSPGPTAPRSRPTSRAVIGSAVAEVRRLRRQRRLHGDGHDLQRELRCRTTTQTLPFTITASTAITAPPTAQLTRPPGSSLINTVKLPIDLNPGALATDAFVGGQRGGESGRVAAGHAHAAVPRLDDEDGRRAARQGARDVRGRGSRQGLHREHNPQAFGPWATPAAIRAFGPFDLKSFRWTDSRGPSYRFNATITETSTTGSVSIAIGRGTKGKYKSYGSAKIRKHAFSKRFRLSRGKWRIRFKYKGNATVAGGFEVRKFEITRRTFFRGATFRSSAVG